MSEPFFGNFDLASLTLWLFWGFFALLIFYIQRENMREGYPLQDEEGNEAANQGLFPVPDDKTFLLPHGRDPVTVPSGQAPDRSDIALARTATANGFPYEPTGDPLADGVGPASWAPRRDEPELDARGHPKIVPMAKLDSFVMAAGKDPRGLPVVSGDGEIVGMVTDMWVDEPEQLVRYLEYTLEDGGGSRLVPMTLVRLWGSKAIVKTLYAAQFAGVPRHAHDDRVTKLEEEKISAYYGGGVLYATPSRLEPQL
ncbi:photosynthetic reaction center subunit H [Pseudoponticoccus marisrubri]|uniref:Reaction center protein H chain n=1 Tax=Pseudoponticoccus marisrubri TaxID=1685382 RepID=A0A0W7WHL0_9RHOB|nr:photosynthetic reaction center subunit H [Pseudoponticoccus marisrubri]KUF10031.1 Reaction center protein H chain [Pseudoponticoccus marisrubri]